MSRAARLIFQDALAPGPFEGEFGHHHWHLVLLQSGEIRQAYRDREIRFAPGDLGLAEPVTREKHGDRAASAFQHLCDLP